MVKRGGSVKRSGGTGWEWCGHKGPHHGVCDGGWEDLHGHDLAADGSRNRVLRRLHARGVGRVVAHIQWSNK
jgi:hypothetical protein